MSLLKFGAVAVVASAITAAAIVGPTPVESAFGKATVPVVSQVQNVAGGISTAVGQAPRTGMSSPGGPAIAQAPVVAPATTTQQQTSTDATVQVYQQWRPSVVTVINSVVQPGFRSEPQPQGTGSGFVIDKQGHILTNNHVVDQADALEVTTSDGTTYPAKLIGRDTRFDLAVVQADIPADQLQPVKLGDSDQLQVGQQVIAIGNPYGLDGTVTSGIVSGRREAVSEPEGDGVLVNAIQTDASINPGNSGGPMLNANGEVIGVTTLGLMPNGGQAGLNFAIPINSAKQILDTMLSQGSYPHPFVGIATAEITSTVAKDLNLPVQSGLLVQTVDPNSAAAQAGLKGGTQQQQAAGTRQVAAGGDIITALDGKAMKRPEDFISYLETSKKAGDTLTLTILRNGQQQDVQVTLGQRPADTSSQQQPSRPRSGGGQQRPGAGQGQGSQGQGNSPSFPFPIP
jgi:S1-C subfamily serine protease